MCVTEREAVPDKMKNKSWNCRTGEEGGFFRQAASVKPIAISDTTNRACASYFVARKEEELLERMRQVGFDAGPYLLFAFCV